MKFNKLFAVAVLAVLPLSLNSCGTMIRLGKDVGIVLVSPILIPMAGGSDAVNAAREVRKGYGGGGFTEIIAMPFMFGWHSLKHTFYVGAHALDTLMTPWLALTELSAGGPEIVNLDFYGNTPFDWLSDAMRSSAWYQKSTKFSLEPDAFTTDAESGDRLK